MIDFIYNLFKSEETKINEEYESYKKKYGDKIKILKQGDMYAIKCSFFLLFHNPNQEHTTKFDKSLKEARSMYINICKRYESELIERPLRQAKEKEVLEIVEV